MPADLLLYNGHILTMDPARPAASAVAIRQGQVVAVGALADVQPHAAPGSASIDLAGRTATPGLNDAHSHPMAIGLAALGLDLRPPAVSSVGEIVSRVAAVAERDAAAWIVGRGYDDARLAERRHPTRTDLDAVATAQPVLLVRTCGHIGVANSRALALAGVTHDTPDPVGGAFDRDGAGEMTGVVREAALQRVQAVMPQPGEQQLMEALRVAGERFLALGVTSTAEAGIATAAQWKAYQRLWAAGKLPVRTTLMMMIAETLEAMAAVGLQTGAGDDWLRIGPAKLYADGSLGGRTSRMREPFLGEPDNFGLWMMPAEQLKADVLRAHAAGFQVGIHAIGDAAIALVLDAYEAAMTAVPRPDPRHRIEHCTIVDEGLLARIAALGVVAVPNPAFLYHFRDAWVAAIGEERPRQAAAMASFRRHGIVAAAGSDAPVVPITPMIGIQTMVTRRDVADRPVWSAEAISLTDALRAYTAAGAYATFRERDQGMLAPGMLGDVTVFATDLTAVPPGDLGAVPVDYTIIDGAAAYTRC